jgi:hypothetical protein
MQKIFSTRLEEATINEIERLARRLGISKRQFLEDAIGQHANEINARETANRDIWTETLGAWQRPEKPDATVRRTRRAFQRSFTRHHRLDRARVRR